MGMPFHGGARERHGVVMGKSAFIDDGIQTYVNGLVVRESAIARALRDETARMPNAMMQIGPDQAQFMQLLARLIGARRYLEVGVFTGYSALAMALALPADGQVVACDVSEEYTAIAQAYWRRAGVAEKIELRLAPALETLDDLLANDRAGFDVAFIDADKANVSAYFERVLRLVRPGGLVLVDNVLWGGAVLDEHASDPDTVALRAFNEHVARDERVDSALVTVCDGILMARKR